MKSLKKNITYNFLYQFLILFLPFVTAPYLSRVLGPEGVGTYTFNQSIAQYFVYIAMLGLNNYGNRSIAAIGNDKEKRSSCFSEIYCMQFITSLISVVLFLCYALISKSTYSFIMTIYVLSAMFDINWLFFGTENFKLTVIRNTIIKLLSMIAIFVFVRSNNDVMIYILIMVISTLLSQVVLWPFTKELVRFKLPKVKDILKHFKPNLMLFIPVIAISIYKIMDKVMLGGMSSEANVGIYEYGEKIYNIPLTLITAVGTVMLPRMTYYYQNNMEAKAKEYLQLSMEYVLAFSNAAMFGLIAVSESFVLFYYGPSFSGSAVVINLLSTTTVFLAAGNVIRTQYLIPKKMDKIYIVSAVFGAITNFVVNYILIPNYGVVGASIGTIVAEIVVFIYQVLCIIKDIQFKDYLLIEIRYLILGFTMFSIVNIIKVEGLLVSILLKVLVGCCIYSLGFFLIFKYKYKQNPISHFKRSTKEIDNSGGA